MVVVVVVSSRASGLEVPGQYLVDVVVVVVVVVVDTDCKGMLATGRSGSMDSEPESPNGSDDVMRVREAARPRWRPMQGPQAVKDAGG